MKKLFFPAVSVLLCAVMLFGCAEKTRPALDIKKESVTSIEFKKTCYKEDVPDYREYVSKTVTEREDLDALINWTQSLRLEKQSAIEVPVERVEYVIVLKGVKEHRLIFLDDYIVYDTAAFVYANPSQKEQVKEKYNLLNYEEKAAELDLM